MKIRWEIPDQRNMIKTTIKYLRKLIVDIGKNGNMIITEIEYIMKRMGCIGRNGGVIKMVA